MSNEYSIPKKIGRYDVLGELGGGGMGDVYRVRHETGGRELALKVLKFTYPRALHYFKREFRAVASLAHEHLVSLYDLHYENDQYFYTMELVDGCDMYVHVNGHNRVVLDANVLCTPARLERVRQATIQLLRGLAFLHHHERVHRDIKPSNILVNSEGRVKLVDFGIVKELIPGGEGQSLSQVFGTSTYFSPEQSLGSHVGPEADLYSVGVLLYELLCGSPPFTGESAMVALKHRTEPPPSLVQRVPGASPDLVLVCMKLLKKKPEQRPTAREALEMLQADTGFELYEPEFIGRVAARRVLFNALDGVREGQGRLVIIEGESGIGKTKLLKEFGSEARVRNARLFTGTCVQRDHVPMRGLDTLVERLAEAYRKETARVMRRFESGERAALINAFTFLGELLPVEEHGQDDRRSTAASGLHRLLTRLSETRLLVLVIEQLHLADDSVFDVLESLHASGGLPPVLIVCTVRPDLIEPTSRPSDFLEFAYRSPATNRVALETFSLDETRQYLRSNLKLPLIHLAEYIHEETKGNPLFVRGMVDAIRVSPGNPIPTLRETVARQLEALGDAPQRIVQALAVNTNPQYANEDPLPVKTLTDATGLDIASLYDALRILSAQDIAELSTNMDGVAFVVGSHEKLMSLVRESCDSITWHTRLAEAHEKNRGPARSIEFHWRQAGQPDRVWSYAEAEVERASNNDGDHPRAVEMIELALNSPSSEIDRVALHRKLITSLERCGRYREAAEAIERLEELDPEEAYVQLARRCQFYLRSGNLAAFEHHSQDLPRRRHASLADLLIEFLPNRAATFIRDGDGPLELLVSARLKAQDIDDRSIAEAGAIIEKCEESIRGYAADWVLPLALARLEHAQADGRDDGAIEYAHAALESAPDEMASLLPKLLLKIALGRSFLEGGHIDAARSLVGSLVREAHKRGLPSILTLAWLLQARATLASGESVIADGYMEEIASEWPPEPPSLPHLRLHLTRAEQLLTAGQLGDAEQELDHVDSSSRLAPFARHRELARRKAILRARIALRRSFEEFISGKSISARFDVIRKNLTGTRPVASDWIALVSAFDLLKSEKTQAALRLLVDTLDSPSTNENAITNAIILGLICAVKQHGGQGGHREWTRATDSLSGVGAATPPELSKLAELQREKSTKPPPA